MRRSLKIGTAWSALSRCSPLPAVRPTPNVTAPSETGRQRSTDPEANEWFDQALFDKQDAERDVVPGGPGGRALPAVHQRRDGRHGEFASPGPKKACFANASISNPWRQTGWITMNEQLKVLQESGAISEMETRDAQDSDDTQIADIDYFINEGNCDVFIISPN